MSRGEAPLRAVIVAGSPAGCSLGLLREAAVEADFVIACDRGANLCMEAGVEPTAFVGDGDSASREALDWAMSQAQDVMTAPSEKDMTDLSMAYTLARSAAREQGRPLEVVLLSALGGRLDHSLGVLGVCRENADAKTKIPADDCTAWVLSPKGRSSVSFDKPGETVSAIPLADGTCISETGMHWELDHKELFALQDLGVSNRVDVPGAAVTCHEGCCLVVRPKI